MSDNERTIVDCGDGAALQMIYAFLKEAENWGHALSWQGASEAFVRSAKILGLATLMIMEDNAHWGNSTVSDYSQCEKFKFNINVNNQET